MPICAAAAPHQPTRMAPVKRGGVLVGQPHEALAAQHCTDGAVPVWCWGRPLWQRLVDRHWQPAQHQVLKPLEMKRSAAGVHKAPDAKPRSCSSLCTLIAMLVVVLVVVLVVRVVAASALAVLVVMVVAVIMVVMCMCCVASWT